MIAHRGFWKTSGSAQNSVTALQKADSVRCYGSEFDVWLTADGELAVNHDAQFEGADMETSTLARLQGLKLSNGETMPSLREYLEAGRDCSVRLILELKELSSPQRETEAVEKIVAMADSLGLSSRMDYISFSLHACKEFVRLAPKGTEVYYLNGELSPAELKDLGMAGLDYHWSVLKDKHPEWTTEAHRLGLKVNCWTVDKEEIMEWLVGQGVDFITTNRPTDLQRLLEK